MEFINKDLDTSKLIDPIFAVAKTALADPDPSTVNATAGSIYDEDGQIVVLKSFYSAFDSITAKDKARYSESYAGNAVYQDAVYRHVLQGKIDLPTKVIASAGGTGAVSLIFKDILEAGDHIIIPKVAWVSYKTMAHEFGLVPVTYDHDDLDDLIAKIDETANRQDKVVLAINSPCQNPTGQTMSFASWKRLLDHINELDKPVVLLNDIAYIDYCKDPVKEREYFSLFNDISDNVLVAIAFSISKTMTAYGLRLGALIIIHRDEKTLEACYSALARSCRNLWSNPNTGAMLAFAKVINEDYEEFLKEKARYIDLLADRSKIFIDEAKEVGLPTYEYTDGFFVTIKDERLDALYDAMIADHIYPVKVTDGIRVAICSIPKAKLHGLAKRIKDLSESI